MKKPTGDCYQDSFKTIMFDSKFSGWNLVHGIAVISKGQHMGKDFGHAWLEKGEEVYDASTDQYLPKVFYYYFGKVSYTVSYSKEQAREMVLKFKHYGPWDTKIKSVLHVEDVKKKKSKSKSKASILAANALPSISLISKQKLADAAQKIYDEWDASDPDFGDPDVGFGGICQDIADAISDVLSNHFDVLTVDSQGVGDQHVWCVVKAKEGVFDVDIPPSIYETGGGYNWQKIEGITFTGEDVFINKLSPDPNDFEQYQEF